MTSTEDLRNRLKLRGDDVPKVVFQCSWPKHVEDEERATGSASKLLKIFQVGAKVVADFEEKNSKDALKKKTMGPLIDELFRKELRFELYSSPSSSIPSAEENFADSKVSLNIDEAELLTFTEVLTDAGYELPDSLQSKREKILIHRRIPAKSTREPNGPINNFFTYTLNKTLTGICNALSPEEVYALKTFIINQSEEKIAKAKKTRREITKKEKTEQELAEAISVIKSPDILQLAGLKDTAFYFMILFMFKSELLSSVHTQMLEGYLEGAKALNKSREHTSHIPETVFQLKKYQLASKPPGLCLILAMENERKGNENDVLAVKNFFESKLNYDIIYKIDPTVNDVRDFITKVGESRNRFYDSLVVWFMSHGDEAYLQVKDGEIHRRRDLIQPLVTIDWLMAKPKLFFIQACGEKRTKSTYDDRGRQPGRDPIIPGDDDEKRKFMYSYEANANYSSVNNFADTLVCHATMWYQPAARSDDGSLFIHMILEVLEKKGTEVSIENVLRETTLKMNSVLLLGDDDQIWRQTPYYESSLLKKFIFPKKENRIK